jgi:uncharacterized protein YggE
MKNEPLVYVIIILALVAFSSIIALSFMANGNKLSSTTVPQGSSTLMITATGTSYNASSQADLYLTMNGTGATNQEAVHNISATLNAFNSTVSPYVNGNLTRITTNYFNVYKIYNKTGYQATESLTVRIPNIHNVSGAIGALSDIPNIYVSDANPVLSDSQISTMRITALSLALANATAQAQTLIGRNNTIYNTNISVNSYYIYPRYYSLSSTAGGGAINGNTSIPTQFYGGTNKVTESITVVFVYGRKK